MKIDNHANLTGEQLAFISKEILELDKLKFALTKQKLGDAYSCKYKTLIISEEVCRTASIASLTIVAHELGHALQDKHNNFLFVLTRIIGKIVVLTNKLVMPAFVIGLFLFAFQYPVLDSGYYLLLTSGCLFALQALNQILNIPLEYDASRKALEYLKTNKFVSAGELRKAKKLLGIAAQTYIAGLFDGIFIFNLKRKRKNR